MILVVGLPLGCLSHALLTAAAIRADGLKFAAWVGNGIETSAESVAALDQRLDAPRVAVIPHRPTRDMAPFGYAMIDRLLRRGARGARNTHAATEQAGGDSKLRRVHQASIAALLRLVVPCARLKHRTICMFSIPASDQPRSRRGKRRSKLTLL